MKRIIYDYENPHIVGRSKHSFPLGKVIVAIIVIALAIALIYIIFCKKSSHKKYEAKEYYTVSAGSYSDRSAAENAAKSLKTAGGAGYIAEGEQFVVVAAVYSSRSDADSVAKRYGYLVAGTGSFEAEFSEEAAYMVALTEQAFDEIYKASVSLDKGEISKEAALSLADKQYERIAESKDELDRCKSDRLFSELSLMYEKILSALKSAKEGQASWQLKYCLVDITFIYKNFFKSIS